MIGFQMILMKSYELTLPCQLAYALNCACVYNTIFSGKAATGTVAYNGPARRETSARSVRCRTGWQGALQQDKKNELPDDAHAKTQNANSEKKPAAGRRSTYEGLVKSRTENEA